MHASAERLSLTTKLPASSEMARLLPYVSATGYGLGKSGWVTAKFGPDDEAPIEMLREWIDESFRAVVPKRLAAQLADTAAAMAERVAGQAGHKDAAQGRGKDARGQGKAGREGEARGEGDGEGAPGGGLSVAAPGRTPCCARPVLPV